MEALFPLGRHVKLNLLIAPNARKSNSSIIARDYKRYHVMNPFHNSYTNSYIIRRKKHNYIYRRPEPSIKTQEGKNVILKRKIQLTQLPNHQTIAKNGVREHLTNEHIKSRYNSQISIKYTLKTLR